MLRRVEMEGIKLPRLYIAENISDIKIAQSNGLPYIKWKQGIDELVRCILRPLLEKKFPHIIWSKVLGKKKPFKSNVVQAQGKKLEDSDPKVQILDKKEFIEQEKKNKEYLVNDAEDDIEFIDSEIESVDQAVSVREFNTGETGDIVLKNLGSVSDYCGDVMSCINLEVLQKLGMLPKFLGDIADCIKVNLSNSMRWTEGYNKKLGVPIGKFSGKGILKNLIILDISNSIPRGIAATMISLIDTLRSQVEADLIITAERSGFYSMEDELPTPDVIRQAYPPGQEAIEFINICEHHIKGKEYGHVISFGDHDTPFRSDGSWGAAFDNGYEVLSGTIVHEVHHFHTREEKPTGYGKWCEVVSPNCKVNYDITWRNIMSS